MRQQESSLRSKENVKGWLMLWLSLRSGIQDFSTSESYIDQGLIDSLGLIELIEEVEKRYEIRFNARTFQDRRFVTVDGLSTIIEARLH